MTNIYFYPRVVKKTLNDASTWYKKKRLHMFFCADAFFTGASTC
jgi:hypothetical protein